MRIFIQLFDFKLVTKSPKGIFFGFSDSNFESEQARLPAIKMQIEKRRAKPPRNGVGRSV